MVKKCRMYGNWVLGFKAYEVMIGCFLGVLKVCRGHRGMGKRMEAAALLSEGGMLIIWKFVDLFAKEFGTSKKTL